MVSIPAPMLCIGDKQKRDIEIKNLAKSQDLQKVKEMISEKGQVLTKQKKFWQGRALIKRREAP